MDKCAVLFSALSILFCPIVHALDQDYFQFDPYAPFKNYSENEAIEAFQEEYGPNEKPVEESELISRSEEMIDVVFEGYKKAFPRFMSNKEKPRVLIHQGDSAMEAGVTGERSSSDVKGIIILGTAFLSSPASRDEKLATLAHEFAHLFLGDQTVKKLAFSVRYASGKSISDDEANAFESWLYLGQVMGVLLSPESGAITRQSYLAKYLSDVTHKMISSDKPDCGKKLTKSLLEEDERLMSTFSAFHWDFVIDSPEKKTLLTTATSETERLLLACAQQESLPPIGIPPVVIRTFGKYHVAADFPLQKGLTVEQFFQVSREGKGALQRLSSQFNLQDIRYTSYEDRADQMAIAVIKAMNINPAAMTDMALGMLHSEDAKNLCLSEMAKGAAIPYGMPMDLHHAPCYRVDTLRKFAAGPSKIPGLE